MALQIRRGTEAQRAALSGVDVPSLGELLYTTDTKKLYIGDGVSAGGQDAGYISSVAVAGQDTILSSGDNNVLTVVSGTNITLTTNDSTNALTIDGFNGELIPSLVVGEAYSFTPVDSFAEIEGSGQRLMRFGANMSTYATNASPTIEFASYRASPANNDAGPEFVFRQSTTASANGVIATIKSVVTNIASGAVSGKLVFEVAGAANSVSIDGTGVVGNLTGAVTGDVKGSVFADDSSVMVDAINGNFFGNLTGNVTGNVSGNLTGHVIGSVFADDSTVLVDGPSGVLRGELVGSLTGNVTGNLTTSGLNISTNTISTITDGSILVLSAPNNGYIRVEPPMRVSRLIASINGGDVGVFVINSDSTNATMVTVSAFDGAGAGSPLTLGLENAPITGSTVNYARARGTLAALTSLQANDYIAVTDFAGYDGSSFVSSAQIRAGVNSSPSTGIVPGKFEFAVADTTGTMGTKLTITSTRVTVNTLFRLTNLTSTERDALTPLYGDVIYNTTTNKFQGWQNTSGTTPQWVDLS